MASFPSWVILANVLKVGAVPLAADADEHQHVRLSANLLPPPLISLLTAEPSIANTTLNRDHHPSVVATTLSGLLVIRAHQRISRNDLHHRYFVCDVFRTSAGAVAIPSPNRYINKPYTFGIIAAPGGGPQYMVAQIRPDGNKSATLLYFSSATNTWAEKTLRYQTPTTRPFVPDGAVAFEGKLWWFDLSLGLLTCDPFADEELRFIKFLEDQVMKPIRVEEGLHRNRFLRVSGGKLRLLEMIHRKPSPDTTVRMSTLVDPEAGRWTPEYEARFRDIWDDESYKTRRLTRKVPMPALVDPRNANVIYFFQNDGYLFSVNVPARKVCEPNAHSNLVWPLRRGADVTSRYFLVFERPPRSRSSGQPKQNNDSSVAERSAGQASN